jgi:pimeloyl-ACP methyl ester carboxylesterase
MTTVRRPTPEELEACLSQAAQSIETARGPVEYAERGRGPVILCVHGGPGGYDQGLLIGEWFRVNGFKIIAPSRPGYLGTPLATGETPEEQADALAALLEALSIPSAAVVGASAGGPSTYLLAARHPEKVTALLEIDAVSRRYRPDVSPMQEKLFLTRAGIWLTGFLMDHFPETMIKAFLQTESSLDRVEIAERVQHIVKDESKFAYLRLLMATMSRRFPQRRAGVHNDLTQLMAIDRLPLAPVTCPTLIFHGEADKDVVWEHAAYARDTIAGAELYRIEAGSHIGFWAADGAEAAQDYALSWLRAKMGR